MLLDFKDKKRSIRDQWARYHASIPLRHKINNPPPLSGYLHDNWPKHVADDEELPAAPLLKPLKGTPPITNPTVAIVGAGATGLFTAMILDYLNKNAGSGFNATYDIYEAVNPVTDNSRVPVGGRLYTYNFPKSSDPRHNYFDVGAMRFPQAPDNPIMQRVFDLFKNLSMNMVDFSSTAAIGSLVPYQMENDVTSGGETTQQEYWCYNNISQFGSYTGITTAAANHDPFNMNTDGNIPDSIFTQSPGVVLNNAIAYFRNALKTAATPQDAWKTLMTYDQYSTREALTTPPPPIPGQSGAASGGGNSPKDPPNFNYKTVQWLETFNAGTGWYDQALSETVLESLDFEYNDPPTANPWRCILGGAQQLALNMAATLQSQPKLSSRVTAIRATDKLTMEIDVGGTKVPTAYNGVFNSTTLGCLGRIDTIGANLDYSVHEAIRVLSYGPSAKVGIIFDHAWWMFDLGQTNNNTTNYNILTGGLGHSDLNLRTVVYPSYNSDLANPQPAVLLCSYTWQQDALRMGSLMSSNPIPAAAAIEEDAIGLKALLIRELARLHANPSVSEAQLETIISSAWVDHYSHDWTRDPNCAGAFAFFGPGQFSGLWGKMIQPTGNLIVVGEAASPHHAWVVGALESAVYGVYSWLQLRELDIQGAGAALELLGTAQAGNPFVGLPPYMDTNMAAWSAIFGNLAEEKYFAEQQKK